MHVILVANVFQDGDCRSRYSCQFGFCLPTPGIPELKAAQAPSRILEKTDYVSIIIACVLACGIVALVIVSIHLRRECKLWKLYTLITVN